MFDDRAVWMYGNTSAVERALHAFLGLPEVVAELAEDYRHHGHPAAACTDERPTDDSSAEPAGQRRVDEECDRLARLLESGAAHLAAAQAAAAEQNRLAAVQARELAAFAALRPSDLLDRPDEEVGAAAAASRAARPSALTDVSEWAVDEVMAMLSLPSRTAGALLSESITLVERLPATLAALGAGVISWAHVRAMVDWVAGLDDQIRPGVEAALMARAPGRTAAQLRESARRAALRADAAAAATRLARALRDRSVRMYGERDGMASLTAMMSAPVTRACYRRLEALADACRVPGDDRTKDQRMADCLADLLIGSGSSGRPPVQVTLTVVAPAGSLIGGDEPGEIDGMAVSALEIREMAYALGLLPRPSAACAPTEHTPPEEASAGVDDSPAAPTASAPGTDAPDTPSADDERDRTVADLATLLSLPTTTGTPLAALPTIAVVDEISGALLALTDAFEVRRTAACHRRACRSGRRPCSHPPEGCGLGPPAATARYRPSDPLDRFVRARDRRCRFPGCRARPIRCDLDHVVPYPYGRTSAENLCCLCRHHHRLRHQAPGWRLLRRADGGLEWTLPGGARMVTHPIPFGTDGLAPPSDRAEPPPATGVDPAEPPPF